MLGYQKVNCINEDSLIVIGDQRVMDVEFFEQRETINNAC